jgi:uncharacterized protein involved in exopolysaccharide biosynthesis
MNKNKELQNMTKNESESNGVQVAASDEISLIDLLLILWKGKWIILVCTVLTTILEAIYSIRAPEVFSTSTIFLQKPVNRVQVEVLGSLLH